MPDTVAQQIALALGLTTTQTADLDRYSTASAAITELLKANRQLIFPAGEAPGLVQRSAALIMRCQKAAKQLAGALQKGKDAIGLHQFRDAADAVDSDEIRALIVDYNKGVGADLESLNDEVQAERKRKAQALTMIDRAEFLRLELTALDRGSPAITKAESALEGARLAVGGLDYLEALRLATEAVKALESLPDPVRALADDDGKPKQIAEVKDLRRTILCSPLSQAKKEELLELLERAVKEIKKPDNEEKAQEAIDSADLGYRSAMRRVRKKRGLFDGYSETAKTLLNRLEPVGETAIFLELRVTLDELLSKSGRGSAQIEELAALVKKIQAALDRALVAYESVAANLRKLDGYEGSVEALVKRVEATKQPFVFPVSPTELNSGYRSLADKVQAHAVRAVEVEALAQELIDGRDKDAKAVQALEDLAAKMTEEQGKAKRAHDLATEALEDKRKELKKAGVAVEKTPSPPEGSFQAFEGGLAELWDEWRSELASAWKRGSIDSAETVRRLGALAQKLGQLEVDDLVDASKLATAMGRYRAAHDDALSLVSDAVVVQRPDDTVPADALGAISKTDSEFVKADTVSRMEELTLDQERQAARLRRYISEQAAEVLNLQVRLKEQLDEATKLLKEVIGAKGSSKAKKVRKAEQTYAAFLVKQQIPELTLFVEAELFSILKDASGRADKLLRDARSIHAVVVSGGSASFHGGVTFDAVTQKIAEVKQQLKNKHLKVHRKEALARYAKMLQGIEDRAFDRPTSETLPELESLLDPATGIPKAINEALTDGTTKGVFKKEANDLRGYLKINKRKFTASFVEKDMFKANKAGTAAPKAKNGAGYLQDLLDRLKGLETLVKTQEGVVVETLDRLRELRQEAEGAAGDVLLVIAKVRALQDTDELRERDRATFDKEYEALHGEALVDLEKDKASKKDRTRHRAEVDKDFKLAKKVYEASGKLEDARQLLRNGAEKAAFYGLGGAESKARYARKDMKKHTQDWVKNVAVFKEAVNSALDKAVAAVQKTDGLELSEAGLKHVATVRGRLTRLFEPHAFDAVVQDLTAKGASDDKRRARAKREEGLQRARTYMDLVDNDPDILLLDMSPAGGFGHASAPLKRTLMMLERTMLVSVPHGE